MSYLDIPMNVDDQKSDIRLGDTRTIALFDDEPKTIIVDNHRYIAKIPGDLQPFSADVTILESTDELRSVLHQQKSFTIIFIFSKWDRPRVQEQINQLSIRWENVHSFYAFFIDGGEVVHLNPVRDGQEHQYYSITSQTMAEIRELCAKVNGRLLKYFFCRQSLYSADNCSVAHTFATLCRQCEENMITYNKRLAEELFYN